MPINSTFESFTSLRQYLSVNATSQSCNGWSIRIYHLTVDANCLDYLKLEIDKLTLMQIVIVFNCNVI